MNMVSRAERHGMLNPNREKKTQLNSPSWEVVQTNNTTTNISRSRTEDATSNQDDAFTKENDAETPSSSDPVMDHHPPASPLGSGERSLFKDLTNTPTHVNANQAGEKLQEQTPKSGQNWFARMSDEKRAEYNQKRCIARAQRHLLHYDLLTAPTVQRCFMCHVDKGV
ncbi:hypothetical protein ACQJBY_028736 [Aegilops geniculata]